VGAGTGLSEDACAACCIWERGNRQKQQRLVLQDSGQAARKAATCLYLHDAQRHEAVRFGEAVQKQAKGNKQGQLDGSVGRAGGLFLALASAHVGGDPPITRGDKERGQRAQGAGRRATRRPSVEIQGCEYVVGIV
jgi:hypothetical protein